MSLGNGFTNIEMFAQGKLGYSYHLAKWYEDKELKPVPYDEAKLRLAIASDEALQKLDQHGMEVTEFIVGKTNVDPRKGKYEFSPNDPQTWQYRSGILHRWNDYKEKGYSGLIVLGCVDRSMIPAASKSIKFPKGDDDTFSMNPEYFTQLFMNALIEYYLVIKPDKPFRRYSFNAGRMARSPEANGIIYMAFKAEKKSPKVSVTAICRVEEVVATTGLVIYYMYVL